MRLARVGKLTRPSTPATPPPRAHPSLAMAAEAGPAARDAAAAVAEPAEKLPAGVTDALASVISSDDPLDSAEFDAASYINARFPAEPTSERLEPFVQNVSQQMARLDERISKAVHEQAEAGQRSAADIGSAVQAIGELQVRVLPLHYSYDSTASTTAAPPACLLLLRPPSTHTLLSLSLSLSLLLSGQD